VRSGDVRGGHTISSHMGHPFVSFLGTAKHPEFGTIAMHAYAGQGGRVRSGDVVRVGSIRVVRGDVVRVGSIRVVRGDVVRL